MTKRTQQVADVVQRVLSEAIAYEVKDPRVGFATVIGVDVTADLQLARVWVSVMGDEAQRKETMAGLEHAKGFLRRQVAQELRHLRVVPELRFGLDTSLDHSIRIGEVLREVEEERQRNPPRIDDPAEA
jgi:ribosome-binding factor A